jgi:hypothetical protein
MKNPDVFLGKKILMFVALEAKKFLHHLTCLCLSTAI